MFSKNITINLEKKDDTIHIEPLGDVHKGHVGYNKKAFITRCKAIAKESRRYTFFMGDQVDAINEYDRRWERDSVLIPELDDQTDGFMADAKCLLDAHRELCKPSVVKVKHYNASIQEIDIEEKDSFTIKKGENPKIWGLLHGNHEYKIKQMSRTYLENHFCYPNGIDFLGAKAYLFLDIKHKGKLLGSYDIMAMHGSGGGKPETMLQQMKQNNYMDVFFCGHVHQKVYKQELVYVPNAARDGVAERTIHLANTGTFCAAMSNNISGYMDTKNQVIGVPMGSTTVSINAESGDVNGHI